jgi:Holliday junction resolvase
MGESRLVAEVKEWFRSRGGKAVKIETTVFTEAGTPDIFAVLAGKPYVLECKSGKSRLTRIQAVRLEEWAKAGAVTAVIRNVKELEALLDSKPLN